MQKKPKRKYEAISREDLRKRRSDLIKTKKVYLAELLEKDSKKETKAAKKTIRSVAATIGGMTRELNRKRNFKSLF